MTSNWKLGMAVLVLLALIGAGIWMVAIGTGTGTGTGATPATAPPSAPAGAADGDIAPPAEPSHPRVRPDTVAPSAEPAPPAVTTGVGGRVLDDQGAPVVGARVTVEGTLHPEAGRAATTDAEGRYIVPFPAGAWPVNVTATASGFAPGHAYVEAVAAGRIAEAFDITLAPAGRIEGRVVDAGGRPVAGAAVTYAVAGGMFIVAMPSDAPPVATDDDGRFVLPDLPAGTLELTVSAAGFAAARRDAVGVRAGETTGGVVIEVTPEAPLRVRVVDDEGAPVEDATTTPPGEQVAAGVYAVHGLPPGPIGVSATARDHEPGGAKAVAGGPEVVVTLSRLAVAEFVVTDARSGEPLTAGLLASQLVPNGPGAFQWAYVSDVEHLGDGRWLVHGLRFGETRLSAGAQGYAPERTDEAVVLARTGARPTVRFALTPLPVLEGIVLDEGGAPLAGVSVALVAADFDVGLRSAMDALYVSWPGSMNVSDESGRFRFPHTGLTTMRLTATCSGHTRGTVELPDSAGDLGGIEVRLGRAGAVVGAAPDAVAVTAVARDGTWARTVWAQGGAYSFDDAPPGEVLLLWRRRGASGDLLGAATRFVAGEDPAVPQAGVVTVRAGEEVRLDFEGEPAATLHVRVTGSDGPLAGLDVRLRMADSDAPSAAGRARSDDRGEVSFPGLAAGRYELSAWGSGGMEAMAFCVLDVAAGSDETVELAAEVGTVLVEVVAADTDAPIAGLWVSARPIADPSGAPIGRTFVRPSGVTDERGIVELGHLAPARYRVTVRSPEWVSPDPVEIDVTPGATVRTPRLQLHRKE